MELIIGRRGPPWPVKSFKEASLIYSAERDASGEGVSTFPEGKIVEGDEQVARVSYNGRVWDPKPWYDSNENRPIYDPLIND